MLQPKHDVFISHAGRDKERYVQPLVDALQDRGVTFWLDSIEVTWGDSVTRNINQGLAHSRFLLLCLSSSFVDRPWPEAEMGAAVAQQNAFGTKRVLPLILYDKDVVLSRYPLLADLAYREFSKIGRAHV